MSFMYNTGWSNLPTPENVPPNRWRVLKNKRLKKDEWLTDELVSIRAYQ